MKVTWFYRLSLGQSGFTYQKEWYVDRFSSQRSPHPGISFSILFLKTWLSHLYKHVLQSWKIRTNLLGFCAWKWQKRHYGLQPWMFTKQKWHKTDEKVLELEEYHVYIVCWEHKVPCTHRSPGKPEMSSTQNFSKGKVCNLFVQKAGNWKWLIAWWSVLPVHRDG